MIACKIFFQLLCLYLLIINIVHGRPKYKKNKFQRANQLSNLGIKQRKKGEFKLALTSFQKVLKYRKTIFDLHNVGQLLSRIGEHEKACKIYKDAIKIEPNNDRLLTNAASVFVTAGKKKIGLKYYKKAWKISKQSNELYGYNYGITMMVDTNGRSNLKLKEIKQMKKAINVLQKVIGLNQNFAEAYWKTGVAYSILENHLKAVDYFRKALDLNNKGFARRLRVAEVYYDLHDSLLGLTPKPNYFDALIALKNAVLHEGNNNNSNNNNDINFKYLKYSCALLHLMKYTGNYKGLDTLEKEVYSLLKHEMTLVNSNRAKAMTPMRALGGGMNGEMIYNLLHTWSQSIVNANVNNYKIFNKKERLKQQHNNIDTGGKINIGFVSADFGAKHPMMHLLDNVLPLLNNNKYINLFFFPLTKNVQKANGVLSKIKLAEVINKGKKDNHFIYLNEHTDYDAAKIILEKNIDVLIDMNGYTMGGRPEIFAYRPSKIQVGFLGWPSTIGSENILDYTLTDRKGSIIEFAHKHYKEKLLLVPPSLFIGDHKNKIKINKLEHSLFTDRTRLNIPHHAFVFSNHNQLFKISENLLDVWGNIFRRIRGINNYNNNNVDLRDQGHLLWLLRHPAAAEKSILKELNRRGIPNHEVLFSDFASQKEYITRSEAADIFLDNVRYNGGATGIDQYFGNVPSITLPGDHFVKRMGKSLAYGHGMSSNIVYSMKEYEDLAVAYYYKKNSNRNYKYVKMREHMIHLKEQSRLFDEKKWLNKFINSVKGTKDLSFDGDTGRNKYHYIAS